MTFERVDEYKCTKCKRLFRVTSAMGAYCNHCDRDKERIARYVHGE